MQNGAALAGGSTLCVVLNRVHAPRGKMIFAGLKIVHDGIVFTTHPFNARSPAGGDAVFFYYFGRTTGQIYGIAEAAAKFLINSLLV